MAGDIILVDTTSRQIFMGPIEESASPTIFAIADIADSTRMNKAIRAKDAKLRIPDKTLDWIDDLNRKISEARYTSTILENATPSQALEAFRHICSNGVPMSAEDYEAAMAFAFEGEVSDAPLAGRFPG